MINVVQFRDSVIIEPLQALNLYHKGIFSESAVNLLLGTAQIESRMGTYLKQINGPALGVFQMEPATFIDLWMYLTRKNNDLLRSIMVYLGIASMPNLNMLVHNLAFSAIMARVKYLIIEEELPAKDDVKGLARYWKKYYNTSLGKGVEEDFISEYMNNIYSSSI